MSEERTSDLYGCIIYLLLRALTFICYVPLSTGVNPKYGGSSSSLYRVSLSAL